MDQHRGECNPKAASGGAHGTIHQNAASAPTRARSSHPTMRSMGSLYRLPRSDRALVPLGEAPSTNREAARTTRRRQSGRHGRVFRAGRTPYCTKVQYRKCGEPLTTTVRVTPFELQMDPQG
jgi:hypothetical protein